MAGSCASSGWKAAIGTLAAAGMDAGAGKSSAGAVPGWI